MKIRILSSAINDLYSGRVFYEKQGEGIGAYFFDSLFSDIDSLALYAGIHPIRFAHYRLLSRRFPYAIYYRLKDDTVLVCRVLDLRRNPKRLQQVFASTE